MNYTPRIQYALGLVARLHRNQTRRDKKKTPFVVHPFSVAMILGEYTHKESVILAGLLHDILEDVSEKEYSEKEMRKDFGAAVTGIVKEVTEKKFLIPKYDDTQRWIRKKKYYLHHLETASREALLVSAADKLHNLISLIEEYDVSGESVWEHFSGTSLMQLAFYEQVSTIISRRLKSPLSKELAKAVTRAKKKLL